MKSRASVIDQRLDYVERIARKDLGLGPRDAFDDPPETLKTERDYALKLLDLVAYVRANKAGHGRDYFLWELGSLFHEACATFPQYLAAVAGAKKATKKRKENSEERRERVARIYIEVLKANPQRGLSWVDGEVCRLAGRSPRQLQRDLAYLRKSERIPSARRRK